MTLFDAMGLSDPQPQQYAAVDSLGSSAANDNGMTEAEAHAAIERAWRAGELRWKLDEHQLRVDALFEEWNTRRHTDEYVEAVKASGATLDDVWVEEIGRRWGKTARWIIKLTEIALKRPGSVMTYGTAYQKDIAEIIVPLADMLLSDGPDDLRPRYKSSQREAHEGLYFPNGSVVKLVGLDMHPNAIRGRFSDGMVLSEAGFMKRLANLMRAVILPQFQRRPWAFLVCETSTPEEVDHDFSREIVPDAKLRNAYVMRTIDDNEALDEREKEKAIRQAGGRGHPTCEREYYCVPTRDPERVVIPEFDETIHVREFERPAHARCYVAADPGSRDLFALVFGYWDFLNARGVIERSWARRNASTRQVACVVAFYEWLLWGRWPARKLAPIPARRSDDRDGWAEYLAGIPELEPQHPRELAAMAATPPERRPPEQWLGRESPPGRFTYWDGRRWAQNPAQRVSDVDLRFVQDLDVEHGIGFAVAHKDDPEAQLNQVRNDFGAAKLFLHPRSGPVIDHAKAAVWNERRTDMDRHSVHGHFDCVAALRYWRRIVNPAANPCAPDGHAVRLDETFRPGGRPAYQTQEAAALNRVYGGKGQRWRRG